MNEWICEAQDWVIDALEFGLSPDEIIEAIFNDGIVE